MNAHIKLSIATCLLAGGLLAGCGYTMKDPYRPNIRTVAVPIWVRGENVYRRGMEFQVTEAIVKRIESETPYKVTDKTRADTELTGTIEVIDQRVLSFNPDSGDPREMEITLSVSMTWKDLRSGEVYFNHKNFKVAGTYVPLTPLNEQFFQGSEDVVNRLAARVVEQMEANW